MKTKIKTKGHILIMVLVIVVLITTSVEQLARQVRTEYLLLQNLKGQRQSQH